MTARVMGILAFALLAVIAGCERADEADRFYPLGPGRSWSYTMLIRQGDAPEARTLETSSKVTNLAATSFDTATVTPQETQSFGQRQIRLMRASDEGVVELASQPNTDSQPIRREPPNFVLRAPLSVGHAWQSTWQSAQFAQMTLIPMTKTVARHDGVITVPAGKFENCLVLTIEGKGLVTAPEGPVQVNVEGEEWFSPGVGLIKGAFRETVEGHPENATQVEVNLNAFSH